jgi:predicted MFS family arabinose efflux permease
MRVGATLPASSEYVTGGAYGWYSLVLVTLICTFSYLDRDLVVLLLEPMKNSLALTDTQLGSLTGIAFGLFYTILGLPIARWADTGNRLNIAALAVALWGATVLAYPWITGFSALMLLRMAAGVGEAGCLPPTYSLLADYFPSPQARIRAMTMFWLAGPIAALVSFGAGGPLSAVFGWRETFLLMGLPALVLAVLVKFTLREPRRLRESGSTSPASLAHVWATLKGLWLQRSSRRLATGIVLVFAMGQGLSPWYAAFLMRSHGMATADIGIWFAVIFGGGGLIGTLLGGYLARYLFPHNERQQMWLGAASVAMLFPSLLLFLLLPGKNQALAALVPVAWTGSLFLGPTFAILQRLAPQEISATVLSIVMLVANLLGMGVTPLLVGIASDALKPSLGPDSLRQVLAVLSFLALLAAYQLWQCGRTVMADLETPRPPGLIRTVIVEA